MEQPTRLTLTPEQLQAVQDMILADVAEHFGTPTPYFAYNHGGEMAVLPLSDIFYICGNHIVSGGSEKAIAILRAWQVDATEEAGDTEPLKETDDPMQRAKKIGKRVLAEQKAKRQ